MIHFNQVSLRHGTKLLFENMTWVIHANDKIGLTGANGTGKSSLFALILGQLEEDTGQFFMQKNITLAHVAQETPALNVSAMDYVLQGDVELSQLQIAIAQAEKEDDGITLTQLHEKMAHIDGYAAPSRAARLLHGLGFQAGQEEQTVASFSGGWRMRLNLAQALMCRSDVLLLDEPTNHLDLEAVIWLETWLQHYRGALLLISHDRDFLDRSVQTIAHIEHQSIQRYTGNYSDFERMRAEKLALQQSSYEKQQREMSHMQDYIRRFRAKASKAKQAQSRIKALERMEVIAPAHLDSPFSFAFKHPEHVPSPLLRLTKVHAGYGEHVILKNVTMGLLPGERIGLLGKNGAGKSTLIKILAGEMPPLLGQCQAAEGLRLGYFAQHQLEQLHDELSPLQHLMMLDEQANEKALRLFLGGFAFRDDMAVTPIRDFSGGEKARLVLAILVYQQPNLLLLDEPTNHLDMDMRHALTMALQSFEGAMVLISHDRHLLRTVCDDLFLVSDGKVQVFEDDLDAYATWLKQQQEQDIAKDSVDSLNVGKKEQRKLNHERRKQLKPLRDQVRKLEKSMEQLQLEQAKLEEQLSNADLYSGEQHEKLKELTQQQAKVQQKLADMEEAWMQASEDLEAASDS